MKCLLDREHFKRAIFALLIDIHGNRWFWLCFSAKIRMSNGIAKRCNIPLYFMNDGRLWKRLFAIAYHNLITFILICRTFEFLPAWENGAYLLNETVSAPLHGEPLHVKLGNRKIMRSSSNLRLYLYQLN